MVPANPWMIVPFVLLLGAIASGPVLAPKWWLQHYAKVALGLGAITLVTIFLSCATRTAWAHTGHEYVSFIALVGSLYGRFRRHHIGVKGGIHALQKCHFFIHRRGSGKYSRHNGCGHAVDPSVDPDE